MDRIKELAGQSGFDVTHDKWIFCDDPAGEGECHELLERFAELIVRKCADIAETAEPYQSSDPIKQHFGIGNV